MRELDSVSVHIEMVTAISGDHLYVKYLAPIGRGQLEGVRLWGSAGRGQTLDSGFSVASSRKMTRKSEKWRLLLLRAELRSHFWPNCDGRDLGLVFGVLAELENRKGISHRFDCVAVTVYDSQGRTAEQRSGIIHDEEV